MTSRIEELFIQTRNHPVCGYLIPLESVLSYPIPVIESGQIFLKFLVYQRGWAPRGSRRPVHPPHAKITIEYPSGRFIEYKDLKNESTIETIGEYPHDTISKLSVDEIIDLQETFYLVTEYLIPMLNRSPENEEERGYVTRYKELANLLIEPGLRPYYQELNPILFRWLNLT